MKSLLCLVTLFSICTAFSPIVFTAEHNNLEQVSYRTILNLQTTTPDKVIKYGPAKQQFIEGWFPSDKNLADIVFIHGGCWLSAYDIAHSRAFTSALRGAGYRVWSLEYRRIGDENGGWPNSLKDINSAIALLIKENKIVPQNTLLMGHSAGGHLALLAKQEASEHKLKGVIGLAAITNIEAYAKGNNSCQHAASLFMDGMPQDKPEAYNQANPKQQILHGNTWLLYSEHDAIIPASQIDDLNNVRLVKVDKAGHFDFLHPGSTAFSEIIRVIQSALK